MKYSYKNLMIFLLSTIVLLLSIFFIRPAMAQEPVPLKPMDVNLSVQEDSLLGPIGQIKSSLSLGDDEAAAVEIDGGARVVRLNGTYGFALNDTNRIKFSAEYLLENLDFSFYTGDTRQWVDQGAVGASYQYLLDNDIFKNLAIGSHYSHAPSKNLNDKTIVYADGSSLTDYRRIAGGNDWNGTAETGLHLWPKSLLTIGGDYDRVRYDTEYSQQNGHDAQGFGGHAKLEQLLKPELQLTAQSTLSQLFNSYEAGLNWIFASTSKTLLSTGLTSNYTQDHTTERNFWVNSINLNIVWDVPQAEKDKSHTDETPIANQDLRNWVQTPAVRMPDVLAISDEYVVKTAATQPSTPITGMCPSSLTVQYNSTTHTYSASGGWFQSYPKTPMPSSPFPLAFDSANILGTPSGKIACFYILGGVASNRLILENNHYQNASSSGPNWVANGTSAFWPTTEPTPNMTCPTVTEQCPFTTG